MHLESNPKQFVYTLYTLWQFLLILLIFMMGKVKQVNWAEFFTKNRPFSFWSQQTCWHLNALALNVESNWIFGHLEKDYGDICFVKGLIFCQLSSVSMCLILFDFDFGLILPFPLNIKNEWDFSETTLAWKHS